MSVQDFAKLDRWIASLRELPNMAKRAAELVAEPARAAMAAPLNAGESPDGEAWAPKKDGGRAYANAGANLRVKVAGQRLVFSIGKPDIFGHLGVRGMTPRKMLPSVLTPPAVAAAIRARLFEEFRRVMGGR